MSKRYSLKFWLFFWLISAIFLTSWYVYWNTRNSGVAYTVSNVMKILPIGAEKKKQYQALAAIGDFFLKTGKQEKTLLVLFQNNLEIRPGGGFLGAFAIVKLQGGKIVSMEIHDLSNFDAGVPATIQPPYPIKETMRTSAWKMRDSNFSPDFAVNAKQAIDFYHMGNGTEEIDGVIGITSEVLTSVLKVTGPIAIEGYPGTYDSENAVMALEYQVEKAFEQQGIARGERKSIMGELASEIEKRILILSPSQKISLAKILQKDLARKDIQMQFSDPVLQQAAENAKWAGMVDAAWDQDYLMTSDANLGAFKSDYYVKRSIDYAVDLTRPQPTANLKITYRHTATQKDWMTRDYQTYLRVYVPEGSWLSQENSKNFDDVRFGHEFGKKYFGAIVKVPIGSSKTVELSYTLPEKVREGDYNLLIQKQAGLSGVPVSVSVAELDGTSVSFSTEMDQDLLAENLLKVQ